jgi:NAD+ synthase (glutamine-hydrolysing)
MNLSAVERERKEPLAQNSSFATEKPYVSTVFPTDISCEALPQKINPAPFVKNPEEALAIQTAGLVKRIRHTNGTAVIGVSGGLDSCLALLVAARAYTLLNKPVSEIVAVTMPGFGTTSRTKNNAHKLCEALGIPCREIDITESVALHLKNINHPQGVYDVVFENAQARMRTYILMDIANQVNGQVIGTGSLSELALGWATYNGDHMSMYSVNAGVPKTLVRHLIEHIAAKSENAALKEVLESILASKFSPELLPTLNGETTQITEDLVGPYELHDFFIYHFLRHNRAPKEIFALAKLAFGGTYTPEEILKWLKIFYTRFFAQQFKRSCLPDGPQVVEVSLSPRAGFKMPSDASAEIWIKEFFMA